MTVVVGVDGSLSGLDAVREAVREARGLGTSVRLVHAFGWPPPAIPFAPPPVLDPAEGVLRGEGRRMLREAETMARQTDPAVPIERRLLTGGATRVLLQEAAKGELVVLGDRGLGGFTGLLVGSMAVHLSAHSPVPVLVVKGNIGAQGPVVVGIDGSSDSADTLAWAVHEAAMRGALLHMVHATAAGTAAHDIFSNVEDVAVRRETVPGPAAETLLRLSETAQLVVVGSRGRGGFAGLLLGSVSQQLLHHAHCPVLIVPHRNRRM